MIPKFRAWDSVEKKFVEHFFITDNGLICNMEKPTSGYNSPIPIEKSELILMQSTGLFDKNNKEIFEGDIVRVLDSPYTVFYDNERGSYRLKPHDDRWNVDYMSNFSHGGNFEVVGNIYENKEQL
jgi:uncharacterized phage protein (TIGR01671 family)